LVLVAEEDSAGTADSTASAPAPADAATASS